MKAAKNRPCRFCSQTGHKDLVCPKGTFWLCIKEKPAALLKLIFHT